MGGEYGGAATYVAEHAPAGKRGLFTSWIQTTATLGLFGWFGGFLPTTAFAMVAATGDIYYGLWYPAVARVTLIVGLSFLPETFKRAIDG